MEAFILNVLGLFFIISFCIAVVSLIKSPVRETTTVTTEFSEIQVEREVPSYDALSAFRQKCQEDFKSSFAATNVKKAGQPKSAAKQTAAPVSTVPSVIRVNSSASVTPMASPRI